MKQRTILQPGTSCSDLIVYSHIDGSILRPVVPTVTQDTFVTLFFGAGTSAYKGSIAKFGGWRGFVADIEREVGHPLNRTALVTWSAGSQSAMEACAATDPPDVVVMLDGLYGGKPKGSKMGDGQVLTSPGLDAVTAFATSAARREKTPRGVERTMVIFHSRIPTTYASSKECAEHVQARVEQALGAKMTPATDVDPVMLDGHFFVEALAIGNLRIVEFGGANAGEHIREAHLWDEALKLWTPWVSGSNVCVTDKVTAPALLRVLDVFSPMLRGPDVMAWQRFVKSQGLELEVDGKYGPITASKTQLWQRAYGIPETAKLDAITYQTAVEAGYVQPAAIGPVAPVPAPLPTPKPTTPAPDGEPVPEERPTLVEAMLARAKRDVGVTEDMGHNDGKRIREMNRRWGVVPGSNWCATAFSTWLLEGAEDAGVEPPIEGSPGAQAVMGQFKAAKRWLSASEARKNPSLVRRGMVPVWDRSDGRPETAWLGHIGPVMGPVKSGVFPTIEGNSGEGSRFVAEMARSLSEPRLFGFGWVD